MKVRNIHNAKHWRHKAEEIRTIGEIITDPEARTILKRLAKDYENLADRIDRVANLNAQQGKEMVRQLSKLVDK